MVTIKEIINSPLLLALVCGGLLYITGFAVVYLLKARKRALELGITNKEVKDIVKSSLVFSVVPSLSVHRHRSGGSGRLSGHRLGMVETVRYRLSVL